MVLYAAFRGLVDLKHEYNALRNILCLILTFSVPICYVISLCASVAYVCDFE